MYKLADYDRREQLKVIHESRKASTQRKVNEAIQRLIRASENINFNSVANEAGISKATLYNHKDLRKRIEELRIQQVNAPTPEQVKRKMDDTNKDAIIDSLQRKIKKLENANRQLREQLKVAYGDVYKKI